MERMQEFLKLLRELQKIDPGFPLQYAVCLTLISMQEGLSISDLSMKAGLSMSTVSRIVGALSTDRQKGIPYGLVRVETCKEEKRRKKLLLTVKGRAFINSIADMMGTIHTPEDTSSTKLATRA